MTGIYKITNKINNKMYIGQSKDIKKRWKQHLYEMNNKKSHSYNYELYRSMRKHGVENFSFDILEECNVEDLNRREMYWVNFYDTYFNGYNKTLGGEQSSRVDKKIIL